MVNIRTYSMEDMLVGLENHPYLLRKMRGSIQASVRSGLEIGFLILDKWVQTEPKYGQAGELTLGSHPAIMATFHTHLPDGEIEGNLGYSVDDAMSMVRNDEHAMIIGGPYNQRGILYAAVVYTPFKGFEDLRKITPANGIPTGLDYNTYLSLRHQRSIFNRAVISLAEDDLKRGNLTILRRDTF